MRIWKSIGTSIFSASLIIYLQGCSPMEAHLQKVDVNLMAEPVEKAISQTHGLAQRVSLGHNLESLKGTFASSLTAEDFDGHPFLHITFFTPSKITDIFSAGLQMDRTQWADTEVTDETISYYTTIGGASTARAPISSSELGVELMIQFAKAANMIGGTEKIKRIVASDPETFFLETVHGHFFDIHKSNFVTSSEMALLKERYEKVKTYLGNKEYQDLIAEAWSNDDGGADSSGPRLSAQSLSANNALDEDGNINVSRMITSLSTAEIQLLQTSVADSPGNVESQAEQAHKTCIFWGAVCWISRHTGKIASLSQRFLMSGGWAQLPEYHGLKYKFTKRPPACVQFMGRAYLAGDRNTGTAPIGCGPSAFSSLMDWWWRHKGKRFWGKGFNGEAPPYIVSNNQFFGFNIQENSIWENIFRKDSTGASWITKQFNTCYFINGTLTLPHNFHVGASRVLASSGGGMGYKWNYNYLGGNAIPFINNTGALASNLRNSIGKRNIPAVALYPYGGGAYHYSTVLEYDIRYGVGYTSVRIKPVDQPNRWVSITDPWLLASGVFYLYD